MKPSRILFVAMAHSVHTARWLNLAGDQSAYEILLYPALYLEPNPDLSPRVTLLYPSFTGRRFHSEPRFSYVHRIIDFLRCRFTGLPMDIYHQSPAALARLIREYKPDVVHALEMQHAGYLTVQAIELLAANERPLFGIGNWGSDIFHFEHQPQHKKWIRRVMNTINFYSSECERDVALARSYGFTKYTWPVVPNSGGVNMAQATALYSAAPPPSKRTAIMIKGYQHFAGRALTSLAALERCVEEIRRFTLCIFTPAPVVRKAFTEFGKKHDLKIQFIEKIPPAYMLEAFANARCYIGTSISDGISTSALEAMAMGCFPIQSNSSCCLEWFKHGKTGFAPPPNDVAAIAVAIKTALADDAMVDNAAPVNRETIARHGDGAIIQNIILAEYARLLS